ncbi:alkaline phosphatase [Desulfatibacillum aliphaticivorans]|uniref:alkaline phosphatase n=1 Tax=Desulfatibacillum aliphaticivorans TaxID=218208 RepID=UPI0004086ACE|nr:alkaline phosphatase [Desulfatibacillum aliphaticivorans]
MKPRSGFGRIAGCLLMAAALFIMAAGPVCAEAEMYKGFRKAKYVFLFIGDGMGMPQRSAAEVYLSDEANGGSQKLLAMNQFPAQGVTTTHANNRFITGSAASATAMACGVKTNINFIGVDPELNPVPTIAEVAKEKGMSVGIVSSVSIDHATPAAFYAHQPTRKMYHEIDVDLAESGFDYFGGGGFVDPTGKKSKAPQGDALEIAKRRGYTIITDKTEFMNYDGDKLIAYNNRLPDGKALPYAIDNSALDINLEEFTQKGIDILSKNKNGFFLMVEGGKIDWACHANDAVSAIQDTLAFDNSIKAALDFYKEHPKNTLIIVTGDHECGGMTLGFAGTVYSTQFDVLSKQRLSFQAFTDHIVDKYKKEHAKDGGDFNDIVPMLSYYFGLETQGEGPMVLKDFELAELNKAFQQTMKGDKIKAGTQEYLLYGSYDPLTMKVTHILNQKAGIGWTSYSHTGVPITTSAMGLGCEIFNGFYDNTDIPKKIASIMGVEL